MTTNNPTYLPTIQQQKDHLDLQVLTKHAAKGRYDGDLGIIALFRDLETMIANSKQFNKENSAFLPWRLADVLEKAVLSMKIYIAEERKIPSLRQALENDLSMQAEMDLETWEAQELWDI